MIYPIKFRIIALMLLTTLALISCDSSNLERRKNKSQTHTKRDKKSKPTVSKGRATSNKAKYDSLFDPGYDGGDDFTKDKNFKPIVFKGRTTSNKAKNDSLFDSGYDGGDESTKDYNSPSISDTESSDDSIENTNKKVKKSVLEKKKKVSHRQILSAEDDGI